MGHAFAAIPGSSQLQCGTILGMMDEKYHKQTRMCLFTHVHTYTDDSFYWGRKQVGFYAAQDGLEYDI